MAISTAMCTSFKKELLEAKHNFLRRLDGFYGLDNNSDAVVRGYR